MRWPLTDAVRTLAGGFTSATSGVASIVASATPHTKGAWVELVTSTGFDTTLLAILGRESINTNGADTSLLLDIGIGGSGSEIVLVPDIMWGHQAGERCLVLPLGVPAGSRISARTQSAVASQAMQLTCQMSGCGGWTSADCGRRATTYGANAATSSGVNSATPGAANTKSAWTQITASTTNPIRWLSPQAAGPAGVTSMSNMDALIDIGVGGAGSEQVIIPDLSYRHTSSEYCRFPQVAFPVNLPAGVRLAIRHQGSITTQVPSLTILGVD